MIDRSTQCSLSVLVICIITEGCLRRAEGWHVANTVAEHNQVNVSDEGGVVASNQPGVATTHRLKCTPSEVALAACLNGGVCYSLNLGSVRYSFCHCKRFETGDRCEKSVFIAASSHATSKYMLGTIVVIVLAVIAIIIAIVVIVRLKPWRRKSSNRNNPRSIFTLTKSLKISKQYSNV